MNYRNIKGLSTETNQNLSGSHCGYSPKAYISKPAVFCLGIACNQVVAATRISEQSLLCYANIKFFVESEYFKKRQTLSISTQISSKSRNKIVKPNQN
jgi:hypothetical protein